MEIEFLKLKQGERSIAKYEAKFIELARFAPDYTHSEAQKEVMVIESDQKLAAREKEDKKWKIDDVEEKQDSEGSSQKFQIKFGRNRDKGFRRQSVDREDTMRQSVKRKIQESPVIIVARFNNLINDLLLHDIYYEAEEVNLKFLPTLPDHLEQKISAIREGRDLSRITLEVLYGILKTYELEMIQRKSLRVGQEHVVDGLSALIVSENKTSNDDPRFQTLVASSSEQRNNDSRNKLKGF
ncbi:hypothetical protein AgCh_022007 [Apium graveolens]